MRQVDALIPFFIQQELHGAADKLYLNCLPISYTRSKPPTTNIFKYNSGATRINISLGDRYSVTAQSRRGEALHVQIIMVGLERPCSCPSCDGIHHRCYIQAISAVFKDPALLTSFHFHKALVIQLFENVS